jgi:ribosome-associated translation inhibitor RaiA
MIHAIVALHARVAAEGATAMFVQVHTDNHLHGSATLREEITAMVEGSFNRFAQRITDIEVHLSDQNGAKGGENDVRCAMEVRLAGLQPLAVSHDAAVLTDAVQGAIERLERLLQHHLGRIEAG